jgi:hypothetical protein
MGLFILDSVATSMPYGLTLISSSHATTPPHCDALRACDGGTGFARDSHSPSATTVAMQQFMAKRRR